MPVLGRACGAGNRTSVFIFRPAEVWCFMLDGSHWPHHFLNYGINLTSARCEDYYVHAQGSNRSAALWWLPRC
jgi:hypothetical protein